jgi:hypothetical protein
MSSGTGGKINPQEANQLLHKWISEGVKVEVFLSTPCSIQAIITGSIEFDPNGNLCVIASDDADSPLFIRFDPSVAIHRNYGDARVAMPGSLAELGGPRLASVLYFTLADGSLVSLAEIAATASN